MSIIALSILCVILFACKKVAKEDPKSYIRGRIITVDEAGTEIQSIDKSKLEIKLSEDNSKSEFMYSVNADKEGYFVFHLPLNNLKGVYYVFSEYKEAGINYTCFETFEKDSKNNFVEDTMLFHPDFSKQNFYAITVKDLNAQNVGNIDLFFYTNQLIANNSYTASPTFTASTNNNGVYKKYDLAAGTYYVNAYKDYGGGLILKRKAKAITVSTTGYQVSDTLTVAN